MKKKKIKSVGIITKRDNKEQESLVKKIIKYLKKHKLSISLDQNSANLIQDFEGINKTELLKKVDLAIVLGGDGTILKTARRLSRKKTLVLGVNVGNVGFLTEVKPSKVIETLGKVLEGDYHEDKRALLRVTIYRKGKKVETHLALNDAVINQGSFARLIKLRLEVDSRKVVTIKADGVIIATPTGSTGHSLSAGGPIVHPLIQSLTITPICPYALSMRPIVMPDDRQLTVRIETQRRERSATLGLTIDGQDMIILHYDDKVRFRRSSRNIYFVRTSNKYYKYLRQKLHWGEF